MVSVQRPCRIACIVWALFASTGVGDLIPARAEAAEDCQTKDFEEHEVLLLQTALTLQEGEKKESAASTGRARGGLHAAGHHRRGLRYPILRVVVPFLFVIACAFLLLTCLHLCWGLPTDVDKQHAAIVTPIMALFFQQLTCTLVIPTTYALSVGIGRGAGFSGVVIGVYMLGACGGSVTMWVLFQLVDDLWRRGWGLLVFAAACNIFGAGAYCFLSYQIEDEVLGLMANLGLETFTNYEGAVGQSAPLGFRAAFLVFARLTDGFGAGVLTNFSLVALTHLVPSQERLIWGAHNTFIVMLGLGFGPMAASATPTFDLLPRRQLHFAATGIVYFAISCIPISVILLWYPRSLPSDEIADYSPKAVQSGDRPAQLARPDFIPQANDLVHRVRPDIAALSTQQRNLRARLAEDVLEANVLAGISQAHEAAEQQKRRNGILLCCGLAMSAIRGFVIYGLQAATAHLLQMEYGWHKGAIGIAISTCFLNAIPCKILHGLLGGRLSMHWWIRLTSWVSILGPLMLFPEVAEACRAHGVAGPIFVLIANAILFPALLLGDALLSGVMLQHVSPPGSWFDANYFILYKALFGLAGRGLGPPLAQMAAGAGQSHLALQQSVCAVAFYVLYEGIFRRFESSPASSMKEHLGASSVPSRWPSRWAPTGGASATICRT